MKPFHVIPIFLVSNLDVAERYYTNVLRFTANFRFGDYAGVKLGAWEVHLMQPREPGQQPGTGAAYFLADSVDGYFSEVERHGARIKIVPGDRQYGMRDFGVFDLDGNQLSFGCESGHDQE